METNSKHLEASADIDVPPRSWADVTSAAAKVAAKLHPHGCVALRVVNDAQIRQMNRTCRGVDDIADVLAFPSDNNSYNAGDIALSWDAVERQASTNGNTAVEEATALVTHAMLHLAGYDHHSTKASALMDRETRKLCKLANIEVETFGH